MAEALLRARLATAAPEVEIGSAGFVLDGAPADPHAVRAMAKRGLDISGHRARRASAELLAGTSLILGMERRHIREAHALDPALFARSFTLPELVYAAQAMGPRGADEGLRSWAERVGSLRSPEAYAGQDPTTEIADPLGHSSRVFRACAEQIDELLGELVSMAWPASLPRDPMVAPDPTGGIHADRDRR